MFRAGLSVDTAFGWCLVGAASLPPCAFGGCFGVSVGAGLVSPRCRLVRWVGASLPPDHIAYTT
eukprot:9477919-Pyramimonas_sp.AAC.2